MAKYANKIGHESTKSQRKHQAPNSKLQTSTKLQIPNSTPAAFGVWDLEFVWDLGFGAWNLTR